MLYLRDHKEIPKVLWGPHGDQTFRIQCRKMIRNAFYPEHIFSTNREKDLYNIAFKTGGHLELVNCWIDHDCSLSPEKSGKINYVFC